jgi:hypothetical protein
MCGGSFYITNVYWGYAGLSHCNLLGVAERWSRSKACLEGILLALKPASPESVKGDGARRNQLYGDGGLRGAELEEPAGDSYWAQD